MATLAEFQVSLKVPNDLTEDEIDGLIFAMDDVSLELLLLNAAENAVASMIHARAGDIQVTVSEE